MGKPTRNQAEAAAGTTSSLLLIAGAACTAVSAGMSLMLVLERLSGMRLPGCGEGSACARAAASVWGKIPLGDWSWPVSFVGLAYFLALLVTWIAVRGVVPAVFRNVVRFGVLISAAYFIIMFTKGMVCPYCVGVHVGNFVFWVIVEFAGTRPARPGTAALTFAGVFAVATITLGIWDGQQTAAVQAEAESERELAAQQIIEKSKEASPEPNARDADAATPPATDGDRTDDVVTRADEPATPAELFTGRYRVGPAEAPIRIVMFTDYQCRDCAKIEKQLVQLYESRDDMSVSIKHFPFNVECNRFVSRTIHPNACWAARAAEAAGMLWGPEGFWAMHKWLFDHGGVFETTEQLEEGIREIGYDPRGFVQTMSSNTTLQPIQDDINEAKRLGLFFTPMIFINGVELKGWVAPNALIRTVEQVAATNPPARSAASDRPPTAFQKYVDDWRDQAAIALPDDAQAWSQGPEDGKVQVVLWGDYQEPGSAEADAIIREFAAGRDDVRYIYRHYPFNAECNPRIRQTKFPQACLAAKAAEAAGKLGGNDGFWQMHDWLITNREELSEATLRDAAVAMGFDADALMAAMEDPAVDANIKDDVQAGGKLPQLRHGMPRGIYGIPTIFVNGKYVPRWQLDDQPVLAEILREAAK